jgi:hypothetical protein
LKTKYLSGVAQMTILMNVFDELGWIVRSLAASLTWPVAGLLIIFYFRTQLAELIPRLVEIGKEGAKFAPRVTRALRDLPYWPRGEPSAQASDADQQLMDQYKNEYDERTRHYTLAHVCRPSEEPGQLVEVFVFVALHRKGPDTGPPQTEGLDAIEKAEFFFGESWGNQRFMVNNSSWFGQRRGIIGVRVQAWGTFLAACRITFTDQSEVVLYRFIDFFMAPKN